MFAPGACGLGNLCQVGPTRSPLLRPLGATLGPAGCGPLGILRAAGEDTGLQHTHWLSLTPSPAASSRQMTVVFLCSNFLLWTRGRINLPDGSKHFTVRGLTTAGFLPGTSQAPGLLSLPIFSLQSVSSENGRVTGDSEPQSPGQQRQHPPPHVGSPSSDRTSGTREPPRATFWSQVPALTSREFFCGSISVGALVG